MDLIIFIISCLISFLGGLVLKTILFSKQEKELLTKEPINCKEGGHDYNNYNDAEPLVTTLHDHYGYKCTETQSRVCKKCNYKDKRYL